MTSVTIYRQVLMRMLAAEKVFCNQGSLEALGAVVASLIPMRDVSWGDQVLYDSIHPGARASQLLGAAWAQAIAAHLTHAQATGTYMSFSGSWAI